jgi:predicted HTH domain antitoxin
MCDRGGSALSQAALLRELGRRNVPMSYGIDDLDEDLRNLAELRQG